MALILTVIRPSVVSLLRFRRLFLNHNEALWHHGSSKLLKAFRSDIQDGRHLEFLQTTTSEP